MKWLRSNLRVVVIGALLLTNLLVWVSVYAKKQGKLNVYFLDVGQGDAIFIDSPSHGKILIDGGPNRRVLTELGKVMPFGDKNIDVIIESHPDADHISGLLDVFDRYEVGIFIESGVKSTNNIEDKLQEKVRIENSQTLLARRGMIIDLGDGAKLEILYPNQDVTNWETNDASVVAKLVYGEKSFLLTGDSTKKSEYALLYINKELLDSDVLKAGHHGSKGSTSLSYAEAVSPEYAVISAGTGNRYGHPTKEVLDILNSFGAKVLATENAGGLSGIGTIHFQTNGETLKIK